MIEPLLGLYEKNKAILNETKRKECVISQDGPDKRSGAKAWMIGMIMAMIGIERRFQQRQGAECKRVSGLDVTGEKTKNSSLWLVLL